KVIFAGREPQSFGNLVVIDHGDGWQTAYGFLSKVTVAQGDAVKQRERVGLVGHTGKATRDEVHFELRHANAPVDPARYMPALRKAGPAKAETAKRETTKRDADKTRADKPRRAKSAVRD
ncbi:MAG TPA: M23 family metallopeptidase, partial [Novosphingobium sp.]|nr:M23 family metallopeptidase [Novosphingobium sp.]